MAIAIAVSYSSCAVACASAAASGRRGAEENIPVTLSTFGSIPARAPRREPPPPGLARGAAPGAGAEGEEDDSGAVRGGRPAEPSRGRSAAEREGGVVAALPGGASGSAEGTSPDGSASEASPRSRAAASPSRGLNAREKLSLARRTHDDIARPAEGRTPTRRDESAVPPMARAAHARARDGTTRPRADVERAGRNIPPREASIVPRCLDSEIDRLKMKKTTKRPRHVSY